jgi:diaminopimelate epimerase
MKIRFTKMHGLGNDFIVIDGINQRVALTPSCIVALANRHTGIGFDQCLMIEKSEDPTVDFFYRIFNADGGEVSQCGNGARCLARFIQRYGLSNKTSFRVKTQTTEMTLKINSNHTVTVDMGVPSINKSLASTLTIGAESVTFYTIDVGNPHAVILVNDIVEAPVATLGAELSKHSFFPNQCNIGFMQIVNSNAIKLRVFERGCGETLACGSGAVAAATIGMLHHHLTESVTVGLTLGELLIHWPDRNASVYMTGDAAFIYEGVLVDN